MRIEVSREIPASPASIFPWIGEPEKAAMWQKNVESFEILSRTEETTGTTFRETVAEGSGSLVMEGTIVDFQKGARIVFHLSSRIHELEVAYSLEPSGNGTVVKVSSDISWKFPLNVIALFTGRSMKRGIEGQLGAELLELKELCEKA